MTDRRSAGPAAWPDNHVSVFPYSGGKGREVAWLQGDTAPRHHPNQPLTGDRGPRETDLQPSDQRPEHSPPVRHTNGRNVMNDRTFGSRNVESPRSLNSVRLVIRESEILVMTKIEDFRTTLLGSLSGALTARYTRRSSSRRPLSSRPTARCALPPVACLFRKPRYARLSTFALASLAVLVKPPTARRRRSTQALRGRCLREHSERSERER